MGTTMSESASPAKRSVDEVTAPEVADDSKRSKPQAEEETGAPKAGPSDEKEDDDDEIDDDELAALDTANIISGPRTRGKKIDFRKASEELGGEDDDDDEDADVTANTTLQKEGDEDEEEGDEAEAAPEKEDK